MLTKFSVVSYDADTMGYDTLVQDTSELTDAIFDYIKSFNESEDKNVTIQVTEYDLKDMYIFEDEDDFFNSYEWNDDAFDENVIVSIKTLTLKK